MTKETKDGYLIDFISGQEIKGAPEEIEAVQVFAKQLVEDYNYPLVFFSFRIYTILTDNGREFTMRGAESFGKKPKSEHSFDLACRIFGIEHRKTKVKNPWTNSMSEKRLILPKIIQPALTDTRILLKR